MAHPEPLPRIVDNLPARRPGGLRNGIQPETLPGFKAIVWLANGDSLTVETFEPSSISFGSKLVIPWEEVEWWVPIAPDR